MGFAFATYVVQTEGIARADQALTTAARELDAHESSPAREAPHIFRKRYPGTIAQNPPWHCPAKAQRTA